MEEFEEGFPEEIFGGRTAEEDEECEKQFNRILSLVPDNEFLRPMVKDALKWADERAKKEWKELGFWDKCRGMLLACYYESVINTGKVGVKGLMYTIKNMLMYAIKKDANLEKEIEEEEEIIHARSEVARYWIDVLVAAWDICGEPSEGLVLGDLLFPTNPGENPDTSAEWEEVLEESRKTLESTAALRGNDINLVLEQFCENIKKALQESPIELPDGLDVALDENNQPRLKARGK